MPALPIAILGQAEEGEGEVRIEFYCSHCGRSTVIEKSGEGITSDTRLIVLIKEAGWIAQDNGVLDLYCSPKCAE